MKTIHQKAISTLHIYRSHYTDWRENHPRCPEFIAAKCVAAIRRRVLKMAARDAVTPPKFSVCPVTQSTLEKRAEYRSEMAAFCAGVMRVTGLRGNTVRTVAMQMRQRYSCWGVDYTVFSAVSDSAIGGVVGQIRATGQYIERIDGREPHTWTAQWEADGGDNGIDRLICMALMEAVRMEVGERQAKMLLARLMAPNAKISGYLADDLTVWMTDGAGAAGSYERCAGGEMFTWLRAHPETWSTLLAHAPVGQATATAIQCYPHEHVKSSACHAAGLFETFRMGDSIYSGTPEQIAATLAKINA